VGNFSPRHQFLLSFKRNLEADLEPAVDPTLVRLIGAIYDAVLDGALWERTLDQVRERFDFFNAVLGLNTIGYAPSEWRVAVNFPEPWLDKVSTAEYGSEVSRIWGGPAVAEFALEEPYVLSQVSDRRSWGDNKYYRDFAMPQGINDAVVVFLSRDRLTFGNVAFGRHEDAGPVTEPILDGLRFLAPHIRRAVVISGILAAEREKSATFEAALDAAPSGVVLVERDGRIVHANPAAQAILDSGDPLRNERGRLALSGSVVNGHLDAAIAAAAQGDVSIGRRGGAIPGQRADGSLYVVHIMPLADRIVQAGVPARTVAAVFIADRAEEPQFAVDAATLVYGLTPTEARVLELILRGTSSAEIGQTMSIAQSTLKWHTLQLFEKTGLHRRADLIRLAAQLRPPG